VYNIISEAAKVGIATRVIIETESIDHANRDILMIGRSGCLQFKIVTMKLIELKIEEIPKIFKPKIHMSAAGPGALIIAYGG
jgi:hypothetical protein